MMDGRWEGKHGLFESFRSGNTFLTLSHTFRRVKNVFFFGTSDACI